MKRIIFIIFVLTSTLKTLAQSVIYSENCGAPTSTTLVNTYTGWQNNGLQVYSGNADVRNTVPSSTYTGASGLGNVFITNVLNTNVTISGINTSNYTNLVLSFGHTKTTNASNGSQMAVEVSTNGTTWTALTFSVPTGGGTANVWRLVTPTGTIPSTPNLRIRFRMATATTGLQFRVDDIKLTGCLIPSAPTVSYTSPACDSTTVVLPSNSYLQTLSNGTSTSLSNFVTTSGTYYARTVSTVVGCTSVWSNPTTIDVSIYVKPQILKDPEQFVLIPSLNTSVHFVAKSTQTYFWASSTNNGFTWDTLDIITPFSTVGDSLKINVPNENFYNIDGDWFKIISTNGPCYTESNYGVLYFAMPLPVELVSFDAVQSNELVYLSWITASETNNYGFEIQRSIDLINWENVGSVVGAGFSNMYLFYKFYDAKPINGLSYYRLKQVDFDGAYEYSNIVFVMFKPRVKESKKYYDLNGIQVYDLKPNNIYIEFDGFENKKIIIIK